MRELARFWPDVRSRIVLYSVIMVLTLAALGLPLVAPLLVGEIIDGPIAAGNLSALWSPVAVLLAVSLVEVACLWSRRHMVAGLVSQWEVTWRARVFDHLQNVAVTTHDAWESGQLLSRAVGDLSQLRRFFAFGLPFLLCSPVVILTGCIMLTVMNPWFGVVLLLTAIPTVAIVAVFEQKYRLASRASQDTVGEITTSVEESIHGLRIIRSFGRAAWIEERFAALSERVRSLEVRKAKLDSWLWSAMLLLPSLAQVAIVAVGTWGIISGWATLGQVVAAVTTTMFLRMPIEMMGFLLSDYLMSATAAARYWEVRDIALDITDADGDINESPAAQTFAGQITFDHVAFQFPDAQQPLLKDIDATIEPGRTVALVGATGSGKSALAALIPRLTDPTAGRVLFDGTDIRALPVTTVRTAVSVAFDEPVLFSASVADNVRLGRPAATDDEVWEALRITQAYDFVEQLPQGLDTQVGEQGMSLSGGQRQRIALARAIIGSPRILVLDDPLSAVDVDTEDRVQKALARVLPEMTTVIIAHRPSTAMLADEVLVLDRGTIAAKGTHADLLRTSALYRELMGGQA